LSRLADRAWLALVVAVALAATWRAFAYVSGSLSGADLLEAVLLSGATLLRVVVMLVLATVFWVPISVWVGLRPALAERAQPLAQFLAAFPANVLFPIAVIGILAFHLNPDIWLSLLIIFGSQWYIVFNVVAGAVAFPNDLKEAVSAPVT
jgi:NitT/TauT family transport system permease protein